MRLTKWHLLILGLLLMNILLLCYYTHIHSIANTSVSNHQHLDVTVIIPEFENFDNDVVETVRHIRTLHSTIPILVLATDVPYPYFELQSQNARLVITRPDPLTPKSAADPMRYIRTRNVLFLPDGSRFRSKETIEELNWMLRRKSNIDALVAPITNPVCLFVDIELKKWTLKYMQSSEGNCNKLSSLHAVLISKSLLVNFTEPFDMPFYESFYIQAKLRNLQLHVTEERYFIEGKRLFSDQHFKWKHEQSVRKHTKELYERFGIKHVINADGVETYYGCSKSTPRCFSTVLDVPYYLYKQRWTPPCCLQALRETCKHVAITLEEMGLKYWLEGGSLLGAARNADIIPWDYDVDLGIFMDEIKKSDFISLVWNGEKKIDTAGFVWEKAREGEFIRVQYSQVNHLHVDLFPFYERNGIMTKNTWFESHRQDMEFPSHYLKPLIRIPFVGSKLFAPNNYKDFLELKFGKGVIENPQYPFPEKLKKSPQV